MIRVKLSSVNSIVSNIAAYGDLEHTINIYRYADLMEVLL